MAWCALHILTSTCASRHSCVHFFHISTSKHAPNVVLCAFWLRNVLRATAAYTFWAAQLQKALREWFTFWLRNALRATTACTFPTAQLPNVLRTWSIFNIFIATCALRHKGVQFFVSYLTRWLRTRRFSDPTFRPSGAPKDWKTQCFATFLPFCAPWSSFFFLSLLWSSFFWLSLLWIFPPLLLHLSILSEASLLNFLRKIHKK